MATEKKFAVAGVSTLNGQTKLRFANDTMRIKILAKNGHTDIELIDLPREMTKPEIVAHMQATGFGADRPEVEAAMKAVLKRNPQAKQVEQVAVEATAITAE
jgi:hypothetical protein